MDQASAKAALAKARTLLFVPGNRPERFEKAVRAGADAVVLDLEDAVPLSAKQEAREAVRAQWAALVSLGVPLVIRINAANGDLGLGDIELLTQLPSLAGVMVPKAESAATLDDVSACLPGVAVLPLIESAAGYTALPSIAAASSVLRLVVGHIDFMADTGIQCSGDERELDSLRFAVSMATRARQLALPVDGVTAAIDDEERLREDTRRALRFGFGGKLCIHPKQVAGVHEALRPSSDELAWARRVVAADEAAGGAAVQVDGRMVDVPVVIQARRMLARA